MFALRYQVWSDKRVLIKANIKHVLYTLTTYTLAIHAVTRATVLTRLLYAAPAWWGFSQVQDKDKIERFIAKAVRMGYLPPNNCDFEKLVRGLITVCYLWHGIF